MSTYKLATRYRVAYFPAGAKAGKTDIIVVLEGGASHTYENLAPEMAHHLVDLLRNESPIWVEPKTGLFVVADEPVGSGELP
jgi:hypothetical protein